MAQKEDRRIGTIIGGKWRVDKVLGSGSMATVYAVTHRNGVNAALKILHPTLCTDPKVCERFLGEGHLTNQVKHPGIVRVLDDGMTDDGCVFLVMDMLEGTTLETLRQERGGKLGIEETLDIADALMDALHAVHKAGIIHRDLKPQNVFICTNGEVKLLDFGVARVLESSSTKNKMSLFGMVLGTPSFMSPEQAVGARDQVDQRTDVYSLGATMFTALTGETVHLGPHVQAKLLAAGTTQARSIGIVKQDLPAPLVNVIDTALRFDKADRWQSVDAFRRALNDARNASGLGDPAPVSSVSPRMLQEMKQRKKPTPGKPIKKKPLRIIDKGPRATFIGVGGSDSGTFPPAQVPPVKNTLPYGTDITAADVIAEIAKNDPEKAASLAPAVDPHAGHSGAAKALPVGIIRAPIAVTADSSDPAGSDPADSEDDDVDPNEDHSYPAVHTTTYYEDEALLAQLSEKKSSMGFVLASIALIAAAIGGVAFFAMGGGSGHTTSSSDDTGVSNAASLTSAAAPPPEPVVAPAPSYQVIGDSAPTADAGTHPPPHAAITPPPAWHRPRIQSSPPPSLPNSTFNPGNSTSFPRTSVNPEPPPASTPAPAATPTVSSDPFSTPE